MISISDEFSLKILKLNESNYSKKHFFICIEIKKRKNGILIILNKNKKYKK